MLDIADISLSPEISMDEVGYLKVLIEEHHTTFCLLYPSAFVIPKMNYLVHTPRRELAWRKSAAWSSTIWPSLTPLRALVRPLAGVKSTCWSLKIASTRLFLSASMPGATTTDLFPGPSATDDTGPSSALVVVVSSPKLASIDTAGSAPRVLPAR